MNLRSGTTRRRLSPLPERGHSCPMPLGIEVPHPGGMAENSPTFQRWVGEFSGAQVPKGRLKPGAIRQPSLRDLWDCGGGFPTLKRWAIVACPSGTMTWPGLAHPHPGGMADNSPTFQRWVREFSGAQVPKGRLKPGAIRQPSLRDLWDCGGGFPTLKRWAIVACPSGTMTWPGFAGLLREQFLAALDIPVRSKPRKATRSGQLQAIFSLSLQHPD